MIDPCFYYRRERTRVDRFISTRRLRVERVLATHLHADHVLGAYHIQSTYDTPIEASPLDNYWVTLAPARCAELGLYLRNPIPVVEKFLADGDVILFGDENLEVIHLPGHSPGSLVFYAPRQKCLFSGDTLFRKSIGRTDLPGGNSELLLRNIREKLFTLPDDTIVYPGHDEPTTIGYEKEHNPFLREG